MSLEMDFTIEQGLQLFQLLGAYPDVKHPEIAYAIALTRINLRPHALAYDEAARLKPPLSDYEKLREELELKFTGKEYQAELEKLQASIEGFSKITKERKERLQALLDKPLGRSLMETVSSSCVRSSASFDSGDMEFLLDIGFITR